MLNQTLLRLLRIEHHLKYAAIHAKILRREWDDIPPTGNGHEDHNLIRNIADIIGDSSHGANVKHMIERLIRNATDRLAYEKLEEIMRKKKDDRTNV